MQGIIQKKLASISRTLPLAIFDKKVPFFLKIVLFKTFLGNTSHKVQDWECTSCCQHGRGVKKLVLEAVPELMIIHLKRSAKVESSVEKIYRQVKSPMDKTVIGCKKYKLEGVKNHLGSPMPCHCTVAVKFKERWWNCNDAVIEIMDEGVESFLYPFFHTNVMIFEKMQWCNLTLAQRFWATKVCRRASKISKICLFGPPTRWATS